MKKGLVLLLTVLLVLPLCPAARADTYAGDYVYAETRLDGVSEAGRSNIELAMWAVDGLELQPGEMFSFNDVVGPRTRAEGYQNALNGRGVMVTGGGVAQLASTIYLAALQTTGVTFGEVTVYGDRYDADYVDSGDEAIVTDYRNDIDFTFWNDTDCVMRIDAWIDDSYDLLCCSLSMQEGDYIISYADTPLYGSAGKIENIELCSWAISGVTLESYDLFSFNGLVGPRTAENGYQKALNGRGVTVYGGGVAQVASTIYLAVKDLDCVEIIDKSTYGDRFTDGYVEDPEDAIVTDYNAGTDFSFYYTGDGSLRIEVFPSSDYEWLECYIYESVS